MWPSDSPAATQSDSADSLTAKITGRLRTLPHAALIAQKQIGVECVQEYRSTGVQARADIHTSAQVAPKRVQNTEKKSTLKNQYIFKGM